MLDHEMLGRDDQRFVDISATALNAAISGSILADTEARLVIMMALPCKLAPRSHQPSSASGP